MHSKHVGYFSKQPKKKLKHLFGLFIQRFAISFDQLEQSMKAERTTATTALMSTTTTTTTSNTIINILSLRPTGGTDIYLKRKQTHNK